MFQILITAIPALSMQAIGLVLPGPDFALVLSSAFTKNRVYTFVVALGIAFGMIVHAAYSIYLLPLVLQKSHIIIEVLKYVSCIYLLYMSSLAFKAASENQSALEQKEITNTLISASLGKAFLSGFVCNVLNPKAILFYISIFTVLLTKDSGFALKNFCAITMFVMACAWFSLLAYLFTKPGLKTRLEKFDNFHKILYYTTAVAFMVFACIFLSIRV